ncbi:hypothetical protein [Mucilaginibacter xinganensis]|nr:hypothetical protein [Mucilaginibacter xinganensis]
MSVRREKVSVKKWGRKEKDGSVEDVIAKFGSACHGELVEP